LKDSINVHFLISDIGIVPQATVEDAILEEQMKVVFRRGILLFLAQRRAARFQEVGKEVRLGLVPLDEGFEIAVAKEGGMVAQVLEQFHHDRPKGPLDILVADFGQNRRILRAADHRVYNRHGGRVSRCEIIICRCRAKEQQRGYAVETTNQRQGDD
jgi:hypothetical protein